MEGNWKGFYSYGPEYGEELNGQKVYFRIHLTSSESEFEGTSIDTEGIGSDFDKATIKGFIEDDFISFVKTYPRKIYINEDGTTIADESEKPAEIYYTGNYNHLNKKFEGQWELIDHSQDLGEYGWLEDVSTGLWEMEKD